MKYLLSVISLFPLLVFGVEHRVVIDVFNNSDYSANDAPVVIDLNNISGLSFNVEGAAVYDGINSLPCQLDDTDDDGMNDELCFLYSLESHIRRPITLILTDCKSDYDYPSQVYADMMLDDKKGNHPLITRIEAPGSSNLFNDLYHHGVAFESELTGYRIYFDHRQNIDLYGKRDRRLELSSTGFYTDSLQLSEGYGNDVLWAGNSIGCGSLKLWDGERVQNWTDVSIRGQRIKSCGPVRSTIEILDRGVVIRGMTYNVTSIYTQYAHHRDIIVDVYLDKPISVPMLCTGVQKIGVSARSYNGGVEDEGFVRGGLAASWGSDYPEMGKKAMFPPEAVGLAVMVPSEYIVSSHTDDLNYLLVIGHEGQKHLRYYISFCAAKELEGYHSSVEWFKSLDCWHPVVLDYTIVDKK